MLRDPVCGMQIQEANAYTVRPVGDAHVALCSAACAAQFDAAPHRYMQLPDHLTPGRRISTVPLLGPLVAGALAMLGLLIFYLGMITFAQGQAHARAQLLDDRTFIAAIVVGFGTQVGLYTYQQLVGEGWKTAKRCDRAAFARRRPAGAGPWRARPPGSASDPRACEQLPALPRGARSVSRSCEPAALRGPAAGAAG
jgi:YHS domain-containing protein